MKIIFYITQKKMLRLKKVKLPKKLMESLDGGNHFIHSQREHPDLKRLGRLSDKELSQLLSD